MIKNISYIIYKFLYYIDFLFEKIFKRSLLIFFKEFIENKSYKTIIICGKKANFFIPNIISKWRVETFYTKEPETIEWIDSFKNDRKVIFWDIGANIGLYSIYAAFRYENINITAFEPSTSNLRILSRNISKNNLNDKIQINQFPLTDKKNKYLIMRESQFIEGGAMNTYGENYTYSGDDFKTNNQYKLFGTSIDYLIENKILEVPNYIKIDVDGIEHLILRGGINLLKNSELKSISIELNENFKDQYNEVKKIMQNSNFSLKHKKHSEELEKSIKFSKLYNYIFER